MNNFELKELRTRLCLTQKQLAEAIGVKANTVARWERGETRISPANVKKLKNVALQFPSGDAIMRTSGIILDSHHRSILIALNDHLDPVAFESCAISLLQKDWPGLVHIRGGGDDGFDGAVADTSSNEPFPLIATTSQNLLKNFTDNLRSVQQKGWKCRRAIFATSRRITPNTRRKLFEAAREKEFTLTQTYDQDWFAARLYYEPVLCKSLLGVTGRPHALSIYPISQRPLLNTKVIGREKEMQWLLDTDRGDCLLVGEPGSGKTFLLQAFALHGKARFLVDTNREIIADDIRSLKPQSVIVDDAYHHRNWIGELVQIRRELRADFRIIAVSWPGEFNKVRTGLGIGKNDTYMLERITADVMIEIIKSAGINGPNELLRIIRKQADGRPGLAATLVRMCLAGDIKEVLSGEGLVNQISLFLENILDNDSLNLLGAIALGGSTGVKPDKVAEQLRISLEKVTNHLAKVASSGLISERPNGPLSASACPLAIEPPEIRGALVKRVFYQGVGSLPVDRFLHIVEQPEAACETLVAARASGAQVPYLEDWLEKMNVASLWLNYANLGPKEAKYVLDKHPEHLMEVREPALWHIPEIVIPILLETAGKDTTDVHLPEWMSRQSSPRKVILKTLKHWVAENPSAQNWTLEERTVLLKCCNLYFKKSKNAHIAVSAMLIAFNPVFRFSTSDPGLGNQITLTNGVLPASVINQLAETWPIAANIIGDSPDVPWAALFKFLGSFFEPVLNVNKESKEAADRLFQQIIYDSIDASRSYPGVQRRLKKIAEFADMNVEINPDPTFDCLCPLRVSIGETPDQQHEQNNSYLEKLAKSWANLSYDEIAGRLDYLENQARLARIRGRCLTPEFCEILSKIVPDPTSAAKAFMGHRLPAKLLEPFVQTAVNSTESSWSIVNDCLNHNLYVGVGVTIAISNFSAPSEIINVAIDKAKGMPELIEHICLSGQTSESVYLKLLRADESSLAVAAAIGYWLRNNNRNVNGRLGDAWKEAILKSADTKTETAQHDNYWLEEILAKDSSLAMEWLIRLVSNENSYFGFNTVKIVENIVKTLNKKQRRAVLQSISCDERSIDALKIIGILVGNSLDNYRVLLDSTDLAHFHLAPLAGKPAEGWQEKAVLALDFGYSVDQIVESTQMKSFVFSGSEADMWAEWGCAFKGLQNDIDPRIVCIGKLGAESMLRREENARKREHEIAIRGFS